MKKAAYTTFLLVLLSHFAHANHGVEAIGAVIEYMIIQGSLLLVGLILIIAYFFKRIKSLTRVNLIIGYTAILLAFLCTRLPRDTYDFGDWATYWSPLLILSFVNILIVSSYFLRKKQPAA